MTCPSREDKYIIMDEDITIGCPQHGGFITTPEEHLKGYGCPNCRHEEVKKDLKKLHDRLEYFICIIEGADDNQGDVSVISYRNAIYELYGKINKLGEKYE